MASITVTDLTKAYPAESQYCTIRDVDFHVDDGEFFCLVGPSGSGKTTTLRLVAGLETPETGDIRYDGRSVLDLPANERGASMLFEDLALYPNRTGYENIAHPLQVQGIDESERRRRVEDLAETLGISHLLDRVPDTFSGGEKQRVGIARSIIKDASVHLLDEPLQGLDAKLKKRLRVELSRLHQEVGETFIYATNNQELAMSIADRIAVIRDGQIEQVGEPLTLYDEPANTFVARFIGNPNINLLDGRVTGSSLEAGGLAFDRPSLEGLSDDVTVGIRPHDIELVRDGDVSFEATVSVTEPIGEQTIIDLALDDTELRCVSREPWAKTLDDAESVGIRLSAGDLYLFDPDGTLLSAPDR